MIFPNPTIAAMAAYALPDVSAPPGVTPIVLAQNEHAYPPSTGVQAAISAALDRGHLYPDSDWNDLRRAIAEVHGLDASRILCGSGSMELMQALVLSYLAPQDRILMSEYGYLFMRTLAKMVGATLDTAAERKFSVDIDNLLSAVKADTKLVFVVNPGNPSGTVVPNDEIRRLRAELREDILLLIDEAYAEFVDDGFNAPLFDLVDLDNTVVTRTFSKIYGLAGLRVGWGYFPPALRDNLRKVLIPGNLSQLSQVAATAAMRDQAAARNAAQEIARLRSLLAQGIAALGLAVVPSQTNFVLVDFTRAERAAAAFDYLRAAGIVVRPMSGYGLPHCLRITVGAQAWMEQTIARLARWPGR